MKRKNDVKSQSKKSVEIEQVEPYPDSPSKQKKLDRLDTELTLEYEALEHYKNLIFNLGNE